MHERNQSQQNAGEHEIQMSNYKLPIKEALIKISLTHSEAAVHGQRKTRTVDGLGVRVYGYRGLGFRGFMI